MLGVLPHSLPGLAAPNFPMERGPPTSIALAFGHTTALSSTSVRAVNRLPLRFRTVTPEQQDKQLADRALAERWDLRRLLVELRRLSASFAPMPEPPGPTEAAAGTSEKLEELAKRRQLGYALHHSLDPQLDSRTNEALAGSRNLNGSDTELQAVAVRGFVCERDWKRALVEIDQARISEAQKEMLADEILARADPDYEMSKRLRRIDEVLLVVRQKLAKEKKRG